VAYALVMTPEVRAWLHDLRKRDRASAIQVGQAIGMRSKLGRIWAAHSPTTSVTPS
jgi:hypothetical protein